MFAIGQEVRIIPTVETGLYGDCYVNLEMKMLANQIRTVVGLTTGSDDRTYYQLGDATIFNWPREVLLDSNEEIPEIVEPLEPVAPFEIGDIVTILDNLNEETFGPELVNYSTGFMGNMRDHVGNTYKIQSCVKIPYTEQYSVTLETGVGELVSWNWDVRSLELVCKNGEVETFINKFRKKYNGNSIYRVKHPTFSKPSLSRIELTSYAAHLTFRVTVTTLGISNYVTMSLKEFEKGVEEGEISITCVENNSR